MLYRRNSFNVPWLYIFFFGDIRQFIILMQVVWRKYWEYCELKNTVKLKCTYFTLSCEMLWYNVDGQERISKKIRRFTVSFCEWSTISTISHIVPYCYDCQLFSSLVIVEVNRDLCCNSKSLLQLSPHMLSIQAW